MTEITYREYYNGFYLEASGHAGFKKHGEDIVCAAVSVLCCTLLECLKNEQCMMHLNLKRAIVRDGYFCVEAEPFEFARERVQMLFDTVVTGLTMVSEEYSDFVKID